MAKSTRYEGETFEKHKTIERKRKRKQATTALRSNIPEDYMSDTWDDEEEQWYDDLAEFEPIRKRRP